VRLYKINYTRTALRQYSHNGLPPAGLSAVSLTVPVSFSELLLLALYTTKGCVAQHWEQNKCRRNLLLIERIADNNTEKF